MVKSIAKNIRAFNRYYTNIMGILDKMYLETGYSLTEARVLYDIYCFGEINASQIIDKLKIDKSYLSRVLKKLEKNKLIAKTKSTKDPRASTIKLTTKGLAEVHLLNMATDKQIEESLNDISAKNLTKLVDHMNAIIQILDRRV